MNNTKFILYTWELSGFIGNFIKPTGGIGSM